MHPQVVQNAPGTCPICAMDLVPFDKNSTSTSLQLMDSQVSLANITTAIAGAGMLTQTRSLNARLIPDPQRTGIISARIAGRIDRLYVRETGVRIKKDRHYMPSILKTLLRFNRNTFWHWHRLKNS